MKPVEGSGIRGLRKVRERDHLQKVCKDTKKIGQTETPANQEVINSPLYFESSSQDID